MAQYDSADLLRRCVLTAALPDEDEQMDADAWYALLTDAQGDVFRRMAAIVPDALRGAPTQLALDTDGVTYTFGTDLDGRAVIPYGQVELYRTEADARQPEGAPMWSLRAGVDFRTDGDRILFSAVGPFVGADGGPWARFLAMPGVIDATHQPTLLPVDARPLLVYEAVAKWAQLGGLRDPAPFLAQAQRLWSGDRAMPGDTGLLGALRTAYRQSQPPRRPARVRLAASWPLRGAY